MTPAEIRDVIEASLRAALAQATAANADQIARAAAGNAAQVIADRLGLLSEDA